MYDVCIYSFNTRLLNINCDDDDATLTLEINNALTLPACLCVFEKRIEKNSNETNEKKKRDGATTVFEVKNMYSNNKM